MGLFDFVQFADISIGFELYNLSLKVIIVERDLILFLLTAPLNERQYIIFLIKIKGLFNQGEFPIAHY